MTIRQVKLIEKKEFVIAVFDSEHKIFVVHVAILSIDLSNKVHPSRWAQIAHLKVDKAPTKVLSKYADFANVFSPKLVVELLGHIKINNHAIELVDD